MPKIIACYLRADSRLLEDHILNRMAAYLAPVHDDDGRAPVVHTELFFPDTNDNTNGLSAGICYGGQVFMHPKRFTRSNWEFHSIPATQEQVRRAKAFCDRQRGAAFNYRGFFMPRPCGIGHAYRSQYLSTRKMPWYCSELVSYALLHANILDDAAAIDASKHPNATYHIVQQHCDTFIDCARNYTGHKLEL